MWTGPVHRRPNFMNVTAIDIAVKNNGMRFLHSDAIGPEGAASADDEHMRLVQKSCRVSL